MNIKHFREKKKINQEQLADILNVDRSSIAKWETGAAIPTSDKLPKLAKALECTIDDLFKEGEV